MTVAVLGGGFAGLQAAIALQERALPVVLLERRGVLGGRASSYRDARSGDEVDTGVHVLFEAHTAALDLVRGAGAGDALQTIGRGPAWVDGGRSWVLGGAALPAPWHVLPGLVRMGMPAREMLGAWRLLLCARSGRLQREATLADALERCGPVARRRLWEPLSSLLCQAAPRRVGARLFGEAVRTGLLASRRGARPVVFRCGLSELHERLARRFEARGGRILRGARAEALELRDDRVGAVRYRQRPRERSAIQRGEAGTVERLEAAAVVAALPWHGVGALLPDAAQKRAPFDALDRLEGTPAVSVAFWFDRRVLRAPWLGLVGSEVGRVGTRDRGEAAGGSSQMLQALLAPGSATSGGRNSEIAAAAERALVGSLAEASGSVRRSLVVREPLAAFAQTPEASGARPGPATPVRGLFLAGDWTDTGLPASIEGAVRSGLAAAQAVAASLAGHPPAGPPGGQSFDVADLLLRGLKSSNSKL